MDITRRGNSRYKLKVLSSGAGQIDVQSVINCQTQLMVHVEKNKGCHAAIWLWPPSETRGKWNVC